MERRQASKFYPHFNQEERPVIDYFTGLFNQLIFKHEPILTDFGSGKTSNFKNNCW